jgi:predicted TIM-barrel fold metal-dependent hydrolase
VEIALIDHHCHGVARGPLDRAALESFLTESDRPPPRGCSAFDSMLGIAVRERCAPVLDLPAGTEPADYVARRAELGPAEANRRLLRVAALEALLVDTGLAGGDILDAGDLALLSGVAAHEVVRLESVAEQVASQGVAAAEFGATFASALRERTADAVAVKSIIAYRHGLDFDPSPPSAAEVTRAAAGWLAGGGGRLEDPVLLRHLLWEGLATGLPLQLHTGFGDPDEDLRRCDPALLTGFLRACADAGPPVLLLHCYPFHRHAAYLASVLPHVYLDLGLAIPHVGRRRSPSWRRRWSSSPSTSSCTPPTPTGCPSSIWSPRPAFAKRWPRSWGR